jgi:hypothetical protein
MSQFRSDTQFIEALEHGGNGRKPETKLTPAQT